MGDKCSILGLSSSKLCSCRRCFTLDTYVSFFFLPGDEEEKERKCLDVAKIVAWVWWGRLVFVRLGLCVVGYRSNGDY